MPDAIILHLGVKYHEAMMFVDGVPYRYHWRTLADKTRGYTFQLAATPRSHPMLSPNVKTAYQIAENMNQLERLPS